MHSLMVMLRDREQPINLVFKEYMSALKARDRLAASKEVVETTDDVGHVLTVLAERIVGLLVTDVQKEIETQGEVALIQAREQAKANTKASHDPALQFVAAHRRGGLVG